MLTESLSKTKDAILNELTSKGLADYFAKSLLDHIQPNSTMTAYCYKCKEVDKIDFVQQDASLMYYCNNCQHTTMNLDTELYSFVHFNCIKKKGEKFQ